jgi:actin related protein 2/3 complex subunit 2
MARVFLQEYSEVRKVNGAPPCSFGRDPPRELSSMELREGKSCIGYLSFSIMEGHVKAGKLHTAVTLISSLRDYLTYHIKASKTYLHYRMRKQCQELQGVLNRAKPETTKEKKLMSGKTFTKK